MDGSSFLFLLLLIFLLVLYLVIRIIQGVAMNVVREVADAASERKTTIVEIEIQRVPEDESPSDRR